MKHREPFRPLERMAFAAFALAALLCAWTGVQAVTVSVPGDTTTDSPDMRMPTLGSRVAFARADAVRAVQADPFHFARTAPEMRYRLPEDPIGGDGPVTLREGSIRLLGTAVLGEDGGFVMCQVGSATPETIRIGEEIGDLTLRAIARGRADFERADGTPVVLYVPGAEPSQRGGSS